MKLTTVNGKRFPHVSVLARQYGIDVAMARQWIESGTIPRTHKNKLLRQADMSTTYVANLFRCSVRTIKRWDTTLLPHRKRGQRGHWKYPKQAVLAWFEDLDPRQLITTAEFAKTTKLTIRYTATLAKLGRIRAVRAPNGAWLIDRTSAYNYEKPSAESRAHGKLPPLSVLQLQYGIQDFDAQAWIGLDEIPAEAYTAILRMPWIGLKEVSRLFSVDPKSVKRWDTALLPCWQTSTGRRRYPLQGVLAWFGGIDPGALLSPRETAALAQVPNHDLDAWAEQNGLQRFTTPGGHGRFRKDEVLAALGSHE